MSIRVASIRSLRSPSRARGPGGRVRCAGAGVCPGAPAAILIALLHMTCRAGRSTQGLSDLCGRERWVERRTLGWRCASWGSPPLRRTSPGAASAAATPRPAGRWSASAGRSSTAITRPSRTIGPRRLGRRLDAVEAELRGFAFEGAAMGLRCSIILDSLATRSTGRASSRGPGAPTSTWSTSASAGRWPGSGRRVDRSRPGAARPAAWLAGRRRLRLPRGLLPLAALRRRQRGPRRLAGYARRAFDQGLGRSLWFVEGAERRADRGDRRPFPGRGGRPLERRRAGLRLCRRGRPTADRGVERDGRARIARSWPRARRSPPRRAQRAGQSAAHTELACGSLCGTAGRGGRARSPMRPWRDLPPDGDAPRPTRSGGGASGPTWTQGGRDVMRLRDASLRRHAPRLVALAIIARLCTPGPAARSSGDRARAAGRAIPLRRAGAPGAARRTWSRTVRPVHPEPRADRVVDLLGRRRVALNDLDGDGLPNDVSLRRHADRPGDRRAGAGHRTPVRPFS